MRLLITLIAFMIMAPLTVMGQPKHHTQEPPKALMELIDEGAQVYFLGEFEGMNGWALVRNGQPEYFYENPQRTALVMGLMFNEDGEVVTISQLQDLYRRIGDDMYAATGGLSNNATTTTPSQNITQSITNVPQNLEAAIPTSPQGEITPLYRQLQEHEITPAHRMYTDLAKSNWMTMNEDGLYEVAAFIDPDCPHCRNMIKTLAPVIKEKQIKLRIIPVGMSEASLKKSAVLLASENPVQRLVDYVSGNGEALKIPDTINTKAVDSNVSTMLKYGFDVTPVIVYRTLDNKIRMIRGAPANYDILINDIVNN